VTKAVFRPMTRLEWRAAHALRGASFAPGTFDKRFARDLRVEREEITDKQADLLWAKVWSYRRSIPEARDLLIDRFFAERGSCAFCCDKDARHRVLDAIGSRTRAGDDVALLAKEYDVPEHAIRAVVGEVRRARRA
jgi:hypothetical protein